MKTTNGHMLWDGDEIAERSEWSTLSMCWKAYCLKHGRSSCIHKSLRTRAEGEAHSEPILWYKFSLTVNIP